MTILTQEMIEKATRAIVAARFGLPVWEENKQEGVNWDDERGWARAALTAILPDVVEKCAKVAEGFGSSEPGEFNEGADYATGLAAKAIRSLSKENANG